MRKIFFFIPLLALLCAYGKANANTTAHYAKCTVEVAEESKGLGTVYMKDPSTDEPVMESEGVAQVQEGQSGTVNFRIFYTVADGYVLANFTDQKGEVYALASNTEPSGEQAGVCSVDLAALSTEADNPTAYVLSAHFIKQGGDDDEVLVSVSVPTTEKFGTLLSPVETTLPADLSAYYATGIADDQISLEQLSGNTVPAFTPVILENTSLFDASIQTTYLKSTLPNPLPAMTKGILTGCIEASVVPAGSYSLTVGTGTTAEFRKVTGEGVSVPPYSCWMTAPEGFEDETYKINALPDNVSEILQDLNSGDIYTIDGNRTDRLQKGINIINGKKILVK